MATNLDKRILGYCVHDDALLIRCISELEPSHFEEEDAQAVFLIMHKYYKHSGCGITYRVLDDMLENEELKEDVQEQCSELFEEIEEEAPDFKEFEHHFSKFKNLYIERTWEEIRDRFTGNSKEDYKLFKTEALPLFEKDKGEHIKRGEIVEESHTLLKEYEEIEANPEIAYGIQTGFGVIDHETLGMHPGELWLISGRPGSGKSVMLLNIAINAYRDGKKVMIFSLEMPIKQYTRRFQSCYAGVEYHSLRAGKLTKDQKKVFVQAVSEIEERRKEDQRSLYIVDMPSATALTIESEVRRAISQCGYTPDVVVVDYLGIMKSVRKGDADWQEQGFAAEELRKLARELNIPVITASQLNRDKKKSKGTDRIGRSDIIGATCDVFLQIEEKDEEEDKLSLVDDSAWVYIGKCRDGRADQSFQLWKNFAKMQLKDKATFKTPQQRMLERFDNIENAVEQEIKGEPSLTENTEAQQSGDYIDAN